jgi:hypothetical protein
MTLLRSLFAVLLFVSAPAIARDQAPESKNKPDVSAALTQWVSAIEGGTAEPIVKLYDKNAIMISTFMQHPITKRDALLGYYKKVVANPDVKVEVSETYPRDFGNFAVNTGQYTLSYTQDGETVSVPARFSFTYILRDGKWLIVDHHSSKVPLPEEKK